MSDFNVSSCHDMASEFCLNHIIVIVFLLQSTRSLFPRVSSNFLGNDWDICFFLSARVIPCTFGRNMTNELQNPNPSLQNLFGRSTTICWTAALHRQICYLHSFDCPVFGIRSAFIIFNVIFNGSNVTSHWTEIQIKVKLSPILFH